MKVNLIGTQPLDFTTNDGSRIKGTNVFGSYADQNVTGLRADRIFIRDGIAIPPSLVPGKTILDIEFNNKGKPVAVSIANN